MSLSPRKFSFSWAPQNAIRLIVLMALQACFCSAFGQVVLPSLVGNNMVLQRNKPLCIWGSASNNEKLTISFLGSTYQCAANGNGQWKTMLPAQKAGGPYQMTIKGSNCIVLNNIFIGDVFVCSGQSNMELKVNGADNAKSTIANAGHLPISTFKVPNTMATQPKENVKSAWVDCNPSNVGKVSAVAYFFAKELYEKTKVPIGIIESYWGGTGIETWMSTEALANDPEYGVQSANMGYINMDSMIKKNSDDYSAWLNEVVKTDPGYDNGNYGWAKQSQPQWDQLLLPGKFINPIKNKTIKDGIVWLSTTVNLTENDIKDSCYLGLGKIIDDNLSFVNGIKVGFTNDGKYTPSKYFVPANCLHVGENTITVRVLNYGHPSYQIGVGGTADMFYFKTKKDSYPLAKNWHYKIGVDTVYASMHQKNINPEHLPTLLYNGMIAPLINCSIAGILWYQGESNENKGYAYRGWMTSLITDWRNKFKDPSLPFLFVQLPLFRSTTSTPEASKWAEIREAQQMALRLPNTAMAMTIDLGEVANIHPTNKQEVGKRLALLYRKYFNGEKQLKVEGPVFVKTKFKKNHCVLFFKNVEQGLTLLNNDSPINGFQIETDSNGKFVFTDAVAIQGKAAITIASPDGKPITAVRYAWADNPGKLNLVNSEGLLAHPFRTDNYNGISYDARYDLKK